MRKYLHIALAALLALFFFGTGADARERKKRKKQETEVQEPQGTVIRIRLFDMKELRDSLQASDDRYMAELMTEMDSVCFSDRAELVQRINNITGFGAKGPTKKGKLVVELAKEHLGKPYKLGTSGPDIFDCSGLTRYVYRQIGIGLPHYSRDQYKGGRAVDIYELQEGDLVFFGTKREWRTVGHVGIVVSVDYSRGTFKFIHASTSGGVRISPNTEKYFYERYIGAKRYIPEGF